MTGVGSVLGFVTAVASNVKVKAIGVIDAIFPPAKRAEMLSRLQTWAVSNPKLAAFFLANIALTGFPLFMFIVFTLTVFVFSLLAALIVALLVALVFTVVMVLAALFVVLPTIFLTTFAASFMFLWGLGGYYILKWFNEGESPAPKGDAIGDKLNSLTGGRLDFLMDGLRKKEEGPHGLGKDAPTGSANRSGSERGAPRKLEKKDGGVSSGAESVKENAGNAVNGAAKHGEGVQKRVGGVQNKAESTVGTASGVVGGATGLT